MGLVDPWGAEIYLVASGDIKKNSQKKAADTSLLKFAILVQSPPFHGTKLKKCANAFK